MSSKNENLINNKNNIQQTNASLSLLLVYDIIPMLNKTSWWRIVILLKEEKNHEEEYYSIILL